ncbi:MAG TPA: metallophosphoesterase [Legionella sp.]|nr:metallophosphoesterase [Legionella sp.]
MRIVHISDLHFGMEDQVIVDSFIADLALIQAHLIIISGDVTQRALEEQYVQFQHFLKRLNVPYVVVPGNHDIPLYNPWKRFTHPFKNYKKYVSNQLGSTFKNDEVTILGVNSATPYKLKDGVLSQRTIGRIKNYFKQDSGAFNIVFFHHNLNYFSGMHHPLNNAEEFIAYLKDSPIHMVCTGHLHYATLKLVAKNEGHCAILHGGSLCCERTNDGKNSFYLIDVDGLNYTVDWRVFRENGFESTPMPVIN